jgi:hypothetical protein
MAELPHPSNIYAQHQARLSRRCQVDDSAWGIEESLNAVLNSLRDNSRVTSDDFARIAASARRRERKRALLRLVNLSSEVGPDPDDALAARQGLRFARSMISTHDWHLLRHLAEGGSYADLARTSESAGGTGIS